MGIPSFVVFVPHNCFGTPGSVGIRTMYGSSRRASTESWQYETSVDGIEGHAKAGGAFVSTLS